jgi:pilus assembly protein CpaC
LQTEGLAKIMAETTLVTFSGRAANMIVGGEFPIIVPGSAASATFSIDFREFGNKLDIIPTVLGGGRVRLEVRPELSELDFANGVTLSGFTVPALKTRRADTAIEMNSGETFAIGGLISTADVAVLDKVPYIGDVPIVGAGFRTVEYRMEEKELIILVTPELAEPMSPSEVPCGYPGSETVPPSNHELHFLGNPESPACNECEIARREKARLEQKYSGVSVDVPGVILNGTSPMEEAAAKTTVDKKASVATKAQTKQPSVRPAGTPPGLVGPFGFDFQRQ